MKFLFFANTDWYLWNFRLPLVLALREAGHEVLLLSPPGPNGEKLLHLGLDWRPLCMNRRSLNPVREAIFLLRLAFLMRRERPDIVHGFTIKCAIYGSLAARLVGVKGRVNAIAGMGYVFTSEAAAARMLRPLVRTLLRFALGGENSRLILQNPDDVGMFKQARLGSPDKIRLIAGSGVNTTRFSPCVEKPYAGRVRVLMGARLLWDKGLREYAQAARILRTREVPVDLLLAGEIDPGNPSSACEFTVRAWVEEGLMHWLGHVDDMPGLLRTVDIFVLPSYREGLPKSLIEAGACGCALVATDVPGCREVVEHGTSGLLVPLKDGVALADAIELLVRDGARRSSLGRGARERIIEKFDEKRVISSTMDVYRELLSSVHDRRVA